MISRFGDFLMKKMISGRLIRSFFTLIQAIINYLVGIVIKIPQLIFYFPDLGLRKLSHHIITWCTKVEKDKIMFLTYQGDYTCNPKGIADEIIKEDLPLKIYWAVKGDVVSEYPMPIDFVKRGSYDFYKLVASCKIVVDNTNTLQRQGVVKNKGQYFIQTWHGSLGIKRLDGDVVMGRKWKHLKRMCTKQTDYLISNSDFETEVFHTSYWMNTKILPYGHARNDVFFKTEEHENIKKQVCQSLQLDPDKKTFLYAPTHKDNVDESFYKLDYVMIKEALEQRFGGEWQILVRLHSRLKAKSEKWLRDAPEFVHDATSYDDMQEILVATDIGVTDYSSWIFDYILLRRPGFILADSVDLYDEARGFYYPLETTPFPIAYSDIELAEKIRNYDDSNYDEKIDEFLKARGCYEDGHAAERICKKFMELNNK